MDTQPDSCTESRTEVMGQLQGLLLCSDRPELWRKALRNMLIDYIMEDAMKDTIKFLLNMVSDAHRLKLRDPSRRHCVSVDADRKPSVFPMERWRHLMIALGFILEEPDTNQDIGLCGVFVDESMPLPLLTGMLTLLNCLRALNCYLIRWVLDLPSEEAELLMMTNWTSNTQAIDHVSGLLQGEKNLMQTDQEFEVTYDRVPGGIADGARGSPELHCCPLGTDTSNYSTQPTMQTKDTARVPSQNFSYPLQIRSCDSTRSLPLSPRLQPLWERHRDRLEMLGFWSVEDSSRHVHYVVHGGAGGRQPPNHHPHHHLHHDHHHHDSLEHVYSVLFAMHGTVTNVVRETSV